MQEASLEEGPILRLILDYFERAGHAECLVSLENYCKDFGNANEVLKRTSFPLELAALRELSLNGKWDQVVQYLNAFCDCSDKEGLDRCMYLAERQKYFEILHHIENNIRSKFRLGYSFPGNGELLSSKEVERTQNLIQHQLSVLEGLSPSKEEFQLLKNLFSSSSLSSCKEFSTWQLHSGRLETFYRIGEWVSKVLYLTINFPKRSNDSNLAKEEACSLLRLIAKGLLYEQCEQLCRIRCGETENEEPSKLLDLSSWIQQQPDSSFQTAPAEILLVVKPLKSVQSCKETSSSDHEDEVVTENKSVQCCVLAEQNQVMKDVETEGTMDYRDVDNAVVQDAVVSTKEDDLNTSRNNQDLFEQGMDNEISRQKTVLLHTIKTLRAEDEDDKNRKTITSLPASLASSEGPSPRGEGQDNQVTADYHHVLKTMKTPASEGDDNLGPATPAPPTSLVTSTTAPLPTSFRRSSSTPRDCKASQASLQSSISSSPIFSDEARGSLARPVTSNSSECLKQDAMGTCGAGPSYVTSQSSNATDASSTSHSIPPFASDLRIVSSDKLPIQEMPQSHQALMKRFDQLKNAQTKPREADLKSQLHGKRLDPAVGSHSAGHKQTQELASTEETGTAPIQAAPSTSEYDAGSIVGNNRGFGMDMEASSVSMTYWPATATLLATVSDPQVVRSVAFSESGGIVAVGANSSTLRLCHTAPLTDRHTSFKPMELDAFYLSPYYHKSSIYCLSWFQDSLLASGSNDQTIRLLICSRDDKVVVNKPLYMHKGTVRDITFTPNGLLVSGGGGKSPEVKVTDIMTGQNAINLVGHSDQIMAVGALDSNLLMSGGQDRMVFLWDLRTQTSVSRSCLESAVTSLTICGEGFVAGHVDGTCSVHDMRSQQCTTTYIAHQGECRSVRACPVQPNRAWVLSGSYDGTVCLANVAPAMVDATEHVQWTEMCRHKDKVIQCRWHPHGRVFASTGADRKACFWHI